MTIVQCPVCKRALGFESTSVMVADGRICICLGCQGYFLNPPRNVEYQGSSWSLMRADQWKDDVLRGEQHAKAIVEWHERRTARRPRTVLEIGCGSAFMGKGFERVGVEYTGLDVDKTSVAAAVRNGINAIELAVENLEHSVLATLKFDLVLSSNALEHVTDPVRAFAAIRAAMGGIAVIIVPNPCGALPRLKANSVGLWLMQKAAGNRRVTAYTIDGYWHNVAFSRESLRYLASISSMNIRELRSISINDKVFGFVQPNSSALYRTVSRVLSALDMDSQLMMVAS